MWKRDEGREADPGVELCQTWCLTKIIDILKSEGGALSNLTRATSKVVAVKNLFSRGRGCIITHDLGFRS